MGDQPGQQGEQNGGNDTGGTPPEQKPFTPITSQDDLNRIIADRVSRERNKFADYKDLKAKAAKLDEIEEANKTELQKANDRIAATERERDTATATALRLRVAAKNGISDEDADLFLTGTDEATLTKQAERLAQRANDRQKSGNHVPREGNNQQPSGNNELADFTRQLFSRDE